MILCQSRVGNGPKLKGQERVRVYAQTGLGHNPHQVRASVLHGSDGMMTQFSSEYQWSIVLLKSNRTNPPIHGAVRQQILVSEPIAVCRSQLYICFMFVSHLSQCYGAKDI